MWENCWIAIDDFLISQVDWVVVEVAWGLEVGLGIHLDVIYLEGGVCAIKLMLGAAATLELVKALGRDGCLSDALQLRLLLFLWQQVLLLFLEEEGPVVETLVKVGLAQILPLTKLVGFVLLKLVKVRFKALQPVLNELYGSLAYNFKHLFLR